MSSIPLPDADVLTSVLPNGEIVLLHPESGKYYSLNPTGSLIWQGLQRSASDAVLAGELVDRFDVTPEAASAAVHAFLRDLKKQRLITISQEEPA